MHLAEVLQISQRDADKWPDDPGWTDEAWEARVTRLARLIYRAGARAQLDYTMSKRLDPVDRLRWLADNGFMAGDVSEVLREVQRLRETDRALLGTYGVTDGAIRSMIAEGFHTAFRKATDSMEGAIAWKAIRDMDHEEWSAILDFVVGPLIKMFRKAEAQEKRASGKHAYEQYYRNAGQESPPWDLESEKVQAGWTAIAAAAVTGKAGDQEAWS
jgi:hypothetical protein